jgi:hypothetical protein
MRDDNRACSANLKPDTICGMTCKRRKASEQSRDEGDAT